MDEPADLLNRVSDRDSFFAFVHALIADLQDETVKEQMQPSSPWGPGANGWENGAIEAFLDAALAWAKSTGIGETQGLPIPSWQSFARFLYAGKIYE